MSTTYPRVTPNVLAGSAVKYRDMATRAGYYLLLLIACCSPWGDVFRFGLGEGFLDRGVTTVLALTVITVSLLGGKFLTPIVSRPRVLYFAAFVLLATAASLMQRVPLVVSLQSGANRGGYWILMVAVMSFALSSEQARSFVRVFAISTTLMSIVSLIDYYHVVDVPHFNEGIGSFRVDPDKFNPLIGRSMMGPFPLRSSLAAHLALAWAVPLMELIHGRSKNLLKIGLWSSVLVVLTFAIIVCYSRALYLTIALGALYALYLTGYHRISRILFLVVPLLLVFFFVAQSMFPHEMAVLAKRVGSLSPQKIVETGGHYRLDAFRTTISDLLRNPQGMGFGAVEISRTHLNVHSIFTEHLRPAGWLGFLFACLFMWPIIKTMVNRHIPVGTMMLCASLIGVLAYGTAHSTHNTLGAWVVIGFLYHLSTNNGRGGAQTPARTPPAENRVRRRRSTPPRRA